MIWDSSGAGLGPITGPCACTIPWENCCGARYRRRCQCCGCCDCSCRPIIIPTVLPYIPVVPQPWRPDDSGCPPPPDWDGPIKIG